MVGSVRHLAILKFLSQRPDLTAETEDILAGLSKCGYELGMPTFSNATAQLCADGFLSRSYRKGRPRGRIRVYKITSKGLDEIEAFAGVGRREVGA